MNQEEQIKSLEKQLDTLSTENWDLTEKIANENGKIIELNSKVSTLSQSLAKKTSELEGAINTIQRLDGHIKNEEWKNNRSVKASEDETKRIEDNYNHSKQIVDSLTKTLALANKRIQESSANENHLAQKSIDLYNENTKLRNKLSEVQTKYDSLIAPVNKTPEKRTDSETLHPTTATVLLEPITLLQQNLDDFFEKPVYHRVLYSYNKLKSIHRFIYNIRQKLLPPLTPNTSLILTKKSNS